MAGKANPTIIADRYAQALLELAQQDKIEDKVLGDLEGLAAADQNHIELHRILTSPLYSKQTLGDIVDGLLDAAKAQSLTKKFCALLVANRRLDLIVLIYQNYRAMLAQMRGEIKVEITAAKALSKEHLDKLNHALTKITDKKIETEIHENPELMGGMIIKIGSKMLDGSLQSRLERIRLAMKGA